MKHLQRTVFCLGWQKFRLNSSHLCAWRTEDFTRTTVETFLQDVNLCQILEVVRPHLRCRKIFSQQIFPTDVLQELCVQAAKLCHGNVVFEKTHQQSVSSVPFGITQMHNNGREIWRAKRSTCIQTQTANTQLRLRQKTSVCPRKRTLVVGHHELASLNLSS